MSNARSTVGLTVQEREAYQRQRYRQRQGRPLARIPGGKADRKGIQNRKLGRGTGKMIDPERRRAKRDPPERMNAARRQ